jgi:hypothetical protein
MKKTFRNFVLVFAAMVAASTVTVTPAMAQSEDIGYIMVALSNETGCNVCYQSCMMPGLVTSFGGNMEAAILWLGAVAANYGLFWELFSDDADFFADFPLISNQPGVMRPKEHGEILSPKEFLRKWNEEHKGEITTPYYLQPSHALIR